MKQNSKILIILLVIAAFVAGRLWIKIEGLEEKASLDQPKQKEGQAVAGEKLVVFEPKKQKNPRVDFFVMSFCPFGNQAEDGLAPVAKLLGDKVDWRPHYIVSKVNLDQKCQAMVYSEERCRGYVADKKFPDLAACRNYFYSDKAVCKEEQQRQLLMIDENQGFSSLHGRGELNQDIREICAWKETSDKDKWWQFVGKINENCNAANVDQCWEKYSQEVGLKTQEIKECFGNLAIGILESEVAVADEYGARGSPTVFVNGEIYPPQGAYQQGTVLRMAGFEETFTPDQYRSPEVYKGAICSGFSSPPDECKEVLSKTSGASSVCD